VRCPHSFPRSKHLNLSYERAFGAYSANQEIDVATQHNICEANQGTVEHSTTSLQPIRSEKIKQVRRDRPRSDAVVFKTFPASIAMDRSRICSPRSASPSASRGFQCLIPGIDLPHALTNHEVFAHKNAQNGGQGEDIQKALETLCYVHGCGSVAIESAQIHFETDGGVARQLFDPSSLHDDARCSSKPAR
jgi:hypothetical protein